VSIHDVAETLNIEATAALIASEEHPAAVAPFGWVAVAMFRRDDPDVSEDLVCRLTIISPKGREFSGPDSKVDLQSSGLARFFSLIPTLPYTGDGIYTLRAEIKRETAWVIVREFTLPIRVVVKAPADLESKSPLAPELQEEVLETGGTGDPNLDQSM